LFSYGAELRLSFAPIYRGIEEEGPVWEGD